MSVLPTPRRSWRTRASLLTVLLDSLLATVEVPTAEKHARVITCPTIAAHGETTIPLRLTFYEPQFPDPNMLTTCRGTDPNWTAPFT